MAPVDVLENVRHISPLKSGMRATGPDNRQPPPAPMSKEYLQILAGCNIQFPPTEGVSKSMLSVNDTKLQMAGFDTEKQAAHRNQYSSNQYEGRRNKRINMVDQITRSFPEDSGNPFMRHNVGTLSMQQQNDYAMQNYLNNSEKVKYIRGMHRGSMGQQFLSHNMPEDRDENPMLRNPEKQLLEADAFYGAERSPAMPTGQRCTVFQSMGINNKKRATITNVDLSLPEKEAGSNDWRAKYRIPASVYNAPLELHLDKPAIRDACSKQTTSIRHIATPETATSKLTENNRYGAPRRKAMWGDYTL